MNSDTLASITKSHSIIRNNRSLQLKEDSVFNTRGNPYKLYLIPSETLVCKESESHDHDNVQESACVQLIVIGSRASTVSSTSSNSLACSKCGEVAESIEELKEHSAVHRRPAVSRRHHCLHCEAWFVRKYRLASHIRTHTGEKPYKCAKCSKCFRDSDHLGRHARVHSGVKPHKCGHCPKSFVDRDHLRRHLKVHEKRQKPGEMDNN